MKRGVDTRTVILVGLLVAVVLVTACSGDEGPTPFGSGGASSGGTSTTGGVPGGTSAGSEFMIAYCQKMFDCSQGFDNDYYDDVSGCAVWEAQQIESFPSPCNEQYQAYYTCLGRAGECYEYLPGHWSVSATECQEPSAIECAE